MPPLPFIAFDTETTGVEPGSRLLELAGVHCDADGKVLDRFHTLVDPGMPLPPDAAEANNITAEMVAGMPDAGAALSQFMAWLPSDPFFLVAHHAPFDVGVVSWETQRFALPAMANVEVADTCLMAKNLGETKNNKLVTLVEHHGIQRLGDAHRAASDADACMQLFLKIRGRGTWNTVPWASSYDYTSDLPGRLADLPKLVQNAEPFTFCYEDKGGKVTARTITPYGWAKQKGDIYFHGLCHLRGERRTFTASGIVE